MDACKHGYDSVTVTVISNELASRVFDKGPFDIFIIIIIIIILTRIVHYLMLLSIVIWKILKTRRTIFSTYFLGYWNIFGID